MDSHDPTFLALRDLQIPADALRTSSLKAKEGLVADWIDVRGWLPGSDGIPKGLCVIGGPEKNLAWGLLMKELCLVGEIVTRTTMAELTMHARHTNTTPHMVVGSLLAKARYPEPETEEEIIGEEYNTLNRPAHIFIDDFGVQVTKDMLNRAWARDTILLLAYYTSVYVRGRTIGALEEMHGSEYMHKLTSGNFASIGVLE
jgi:hypothetical protein